jgi:hypothetical protein
VTVAISDDTLTQIRYTTLKDATQQLERVTVAFDGSGAGSALVNQTPQKEVLNQLRELDLRGPHDTPAPRSANASKRAEMMFISSGTAEKYQ